MSAWPCPEMPSVIDHGMVFDARSGAADGRSNAFTSIAATTDGYVCTFRTARGRDVAGGRLRIMGSEDGNAWSTLHEGLTCEILGVAGDMYAGYIAELEPRLLTGAFLWVDRSNPALSFVHPETTGILPTRNLLAQSSDGGATWADWREVDLGPEHGCTVTGPVFRASPGLLALPYETWKSYENVSPGRHSASLRLSRNDGTTWTERRIVAADADGSTFFWDQRIAVNAESGEAVAMFWTHDRTQGRDVENTIAWADHAGGDWSQPISCGWSGQHCQPLWLGEERLLAVHVTRDHRAGIVARLSDDFGRTWNPAATVQVYSREADSRSVAESTFEEFWQEMMTWQFGHPRAVLTPERDVLIVWYAGDDSATSVHWARLSIDDFGKVAS